MSVIVSVDLGNSTGLVVVGTETRLILFIATVDPENAFKIISANVFNKLILERMPARMDTFLTIMYRKIQSITDELVIISPSSWKPIAKAKGWRLSDANTVHEQDAYNMFRYWYLKENNSDIGELQCSRSQS